MRLSIISKILLITAAASVSATALAQDILLVCDRTPQVRDWLVKQINLEQGTDKTCEDITEDDLLTLKRVAVQRAGVTEFKVGDFTGLFNLEILNIRSNPYTSLPEGL